MSMYRYLFNYAINGFGQGSSVLMNEVNVMASKMIMNQMKINDRVENNDLWKRQHNWKKINMY